MKLEQAGPVDSSKAAAACKQRKTKAGSSKSLVRREAEDADDKHAQEGGDHVLQRIKALVADSALRKRLVACPSVLSGLVKAMQAVLPVVQARLDARKLAADGVHEELLCALELYATLVLLLHSAQYPSEAGAGKAPEGMRELVDLAVACAPPAPGSKEEVEASMLWHHVAARLLLVAADACTLNRCDEALGVSIRSLIHKVCCTLHSNPAPNHKSTAHQGRLSEGRQEARGSHVVTCLGMHAGMQ